VLTVQVKKMRSQEYGERAKEAGFHYPERCITEKVFVVVDG